MDEQTLRASELVLARGDKTDMKSFVEALLQN
jgi:hypothetical protein